MTQDVYAMEIKKDDIIAILYESIRELNELRSKDQQLACALDTPLSEQSGLDSLGFVNLVALIDEKCESRFGRCFMVPEAGASGDDPFESVATLAEYIEKAINERSSARL